MSEGADHLQRLNPEQHLAVTSLTGPLLILAGAGSGKTRVLTRRIAHLLHTGADPESILAVTFTNKAASEMRDRVVELVGEVGEKVWVSTFHSTCGRILRQDIEALGFTKRFSIYDDDDQLRIVRQLIADRGWDPKQFPPARFISRIDHYKNQLLTPAQVLSERRSHGGDPTLQLWSEYEDNLRAADAIDFNDLIGHVVRLFNEHPEVLEKWQDKFKYVLVDEYQDTNHAQYEVLSKLVHRHHNLCCVGDDDQSIYGFRGADIRNILDFQKDYPEAKVVRMEQNYRCSKNILAVANAVVAKNSGRIDKALWTEAQPGPLVNVLTARTPNEEAQLVTQAIRQLRGQGFTYEDMVILYRSNRTAQTFERALGRLSIPYEVIGGRAYYERREIRDMLAYLRLVVNPADDAAFLRVCNVPPRGVGTQTLKALREEASTRGEPLLSTARAKAQGHDRAAKALALFVKLIDGMSGLARDMAAAPLVRELLDRSGYAQMLADEDTSESRQRMRNVEELVTRAGSAGLVDAVNPLDQLQAWLDTVALTGTADDDEVTEGKVTLMTVHTSKGLEFPVVFVVHMMEGTFPHQRSLEDRSVEEERRLAYVAFTRAQQRLVISRSQRLPSHGQREGQDAVTSRFLYGLPSDSTAGDLPDDADHHEPPTAQARYGSRDSRWSKLKRGHDSSTATTAEEVVTIDIHSMDQLSSGAVVVHPEFGVGTVRMLFTRSSPPRAKVEFKGRQIRTIALAPCPLKLMRGDEPPATSGS